MTRGNTQEPGATALGLFELPEPEQPLPPLKEPRLPAIAEWTPYRLKERVLCGACTQRIHEMGAGEAPAPRVATMKRKGPNDITYWCPIDGEDQKARDERARKERDERVAINQHRKSGR